MDLLQWPYKNNNLYLNETDQGFKIPAHRESGKHGRDVEIIWRLNLTSRLIFSALSLKARPI